MSTEIKLPEIGEGVTEGELVDWLVKVGDQVEEDQPVAELMTDKATVEIPSSVAGTVKELKFNSGDVIEVGQTLLLLDGASASAKKTQSAPSEAPAPVAAPTASAPSAPTAGTIHPPVADAKVLATPSTRRLAREMSMDINQLQGTGLAGRVTREDVLAGTNSSSGASIPRVAYQGPVGAVEERVALKGIRRKIAENMQKYKSIIPHFTLCDEADVTELVELRSQVKEMAAQYGAKVTYLPFVMKALISTMREYPMFNASIDDQAQEIVYKKYFNIGFAADTPNGLVVPVIKNADQKTILQISQEIVDLATRAREGKLKLEEMQGATITITNIGSVGGLSATPIINHPEVAILGMYKIVDRPVIVDGELASSKMMNFTITADHRLIDGAVAANFLKAFFQRIESPGNLMLDMI